MPTKQAEYFHFGRAMLWPLLVAYVFVLQPSLKDSVALLFVISCYANTAGDLGIWQARRAERRSIENPPTTTT